MYRDNSWRFLAKFWPEKITSRDGCFLPIFFDSGSFWQVSTARELMISQGALPMQTISDHDSTPLKHVVYIVTNSATTMLGIWTSSTFSFCYPTCPLLPYLPSRRRSSGSSEFVLQICLGIWHWNMAGVWSSFRCLRFRRNKAKLSSFG